ncbi:MAG: hypothetical protein OES69_18980 [Myxococcales bacterium]|nr:hypothetical protein [Myxococcales bacterium]MDH3846031.1 hypothetical protein [Myxococcales bacterium]
MEQARERAASIAFLTSIPMVAQLIGGRAVRDALFLAEYDAVLLPRVMLAAAALSLGGAVSVGRVMPTHGPSALEKFPPRPPDKRKDCRGLANSEGRRRDAHEDRTRGSENPESAEAHTDQRE